MATNYSAMKEHRENDSDNEKYAFRCHGGPFKHMPEHALTHVQTIG